MGPTVQMTSAAAAGTGSIFLAAAARQRVTGYLMLTQTDFSWVSASMRPRSNSGTRVSTPRDLEGVDEARPAVPRGRAGGDAHRGADPRRPADRVAEHADPAQVGVAGRTALADNGDRVGRLLDIIRDFPG